MFNSALKLLGLIVIPNPVCDRNIPVSAYIYLSFDIRKFDIPPSLPDPVYRIHRRTTGNDASFISMNLQPNPNIGVAASHTKRQERSKRSSSIKPDKRRNTICCCTCHCAPSFSNIAIDGHSPATSRQSLNFFYRDQSATSIHGILNCESPSSSRVAGLPTSDPPSPSPKSRVAYYSEFSPSHRTSYNILTNPSPSKVIHQEKANAFFNQHPTLSIYNQKRYSAPAGGSHLRRNKGVVSLASTNNVKPRPLPTPPIPAVPGARIPTVTAQKEYKQADIDSRPHSRMFDVGLSPIMEDNIIPNDRSIKLESQGSRPKIVIAESIVDSSDSSYGEILEEKTLGVEVPEMQGIRGGDEYEGSFNRVLTPYASFDNKSNEEQDVEEISAVPMLTLTFPTPEMAKSPVFSDDVRQTIYANDYAPLLQGNRDEETRRRFNSFNGFSVSRDLEIPVDDFGIITSATSALRDGESIGRRRRSTGERLRARWSAIQKSTTKRRRKFWPVWRDRVSTVVLPSNSGNTKSFRRRASDLSASKRHTGSSARVSSLYTTATTNLDVEMARNEGGRFSRRPRVFSFGFGSLRRSIHYVHGAVTRID